MVVIRLFAAARAAAGRSEVMVPAGPIRDVVAGLLADAPSRLAQVVAVSSLVSDGVRLDPDSAAALPDGAVLDVLPPFAGG
ncbi:MAG TPA: MoaD/ThiS family protein [Candidatus Nanopelagicales bacterium]